MKEYEKLDLMIQAEPPAYSGKNLTFFMSKEAYKKLCDELCGNIVAYKNRKIKVIDYQTDNIYYK